jgi:hypothetical protein
VLRRVLPTSVLGSFSRFHLSFAFVQTSIQANSIPLANETVNL